MDDSIIKEIKKIHTHFCRLSMPRDLYSKAQAAFRLGCSENTVEAKYVATGLIKVVIIEGRMYFPAKSIEEYIEKKQIEFSGQIEEYPEFKNLIKSLDS